MVDQAPHPVPKHKGVLAAPLQGAMPEPANLAREQERAGPLVGNTVATEVATHDRVANSSLYDSLIHYTAPV